MVAESAEGGYLRLVTSFDDGHPLISAEQLQARVGELGRAITRDYAGRRLVVVCVLRGAFVFAADLVRKIELPLQVEFIALKSYGDGQQSSGDVEVTHELARSIDGCDILVVEDIVDSGITWQFLRPYLLEGKPNSVKLCALLHKAERTRVPTEIDYLGFSIEDKFVVGYGLDSAQDYRNLPELRFLE